MFKPQAAFTGFSVNDLQKAKQFYGQVLEIETSDDVTLSVRGVSNSHDYSWSIERRDDEFHVTEMVIHCEPDGRLFGR